MNDITDADQVVYYRDLLEAAELRLAETRVRLDQCRAVNQDLNDRLRAAQSLLSNISKLVSMA